jgi:ribonuclease HI
MELYAFLEGLKYYINTYEFTQKTVLTVFSDSAYLVNGITKFLPNWIRRGWKTTDKKPLKNLDIWLQINDIIEDKDNRPKLVVKHVKGHNGNKFQEMSDRLAVKAVEDAVVVVD